jgi:hypothetical protein
MNSSICSDKRSLKTVKSQTRNNIKKRISQYIFIVAVLLIFVTTGCSPHLTPGERKKDIQYLAQWAKDYSPCAELNERVKGCPSYDALLPKYMEFAEQAQSNEEFLQVVYGYSSLIGDSGHFYLIPEDYLRGYFLEYLVSKNPTDISWIQFHEASYWAKLLHQNMASVRPPFRIVYKEDEYYTGEPWRYRGTTIPTGSKILTVNGMTCSAFLAWLKENTWLRHYLFVEREWDAIQKNLLVINEGKDFRGWQVDLLLTDGSTLQAWVPGKKSLSKQKMDFNDCAKGNCVCLDLSDDVGYIRIKTFGGNFLEKDGKKIRTFLERAQGKYRKLIIDIRNNPGGWPSHFDNNLIRPLIREPIRYKQITGVRRKFLVETKQSYLEHVRDGAWIINMEETDPPEGFNSDEWTFYEFTREFAPSNSYNFTGDVYILINGGAGSAAANYADIVKRTNIATLVGQNTGGSASTCYGPVMVRLPESGMIFMLEADLLINPDGSYNEITGTKPDIELPPGDLPKSVTKEELLKDKWINKIINEL